MNEIMLEVGSFVTTGVIDEAFFRRNSGHLMRKQYKLSLTVLILALVAAGLLLAWLLDETVLLTVTALAPIIGVMRYRSDSKRVLKLAIARMKETSPEGSATMTTSFKEDGMHVSNETTGGQTTLAYSSIQWVRETEEHFLVSTKAGQLAAVFKDCLADAEREELIGFLRSKGLKVKTI